MGCCNELYKVIQDSEIIQDSFLNVWNVYRKRNQYIKVLNFDCNKEYYELLMALKERKSHPQIAQIMNIYGEKDFFGGYCVSKMAGKTFSKMMLQELYQLFPLLVPQFLNIFEYAKKENIVFLDLFKKGNVLFDKKKFQVNLIDIDSFQVDEHIPPYLHADFRFSDWNQHFFNTPKYSFHGLYSSEINIFLFYELFFRTFFHKSLLKLPLDIDCEITDFKRIQLITEKRLMEFLKSIGLTTQDNLFERVIDLGTLRPNVIDASDFEKITENYDLEEKFCDGKLVRK